MKDVLFYYPQHFNRSAKGTNPFFDALLQVCDEEGISYDLMEEPDAATDKPRNPKAPKGDAFYKCIWFLRQLMKCTPGDFYQRERRVARVFNWITFGKYQYRNYVTISGSMLHLFAALNGNAPVFDLQHGILFKKHPTFHDEQQRLRPQYLWPNIHWLLWGKGYEECFGRGEEDILQGRTHVVGYPIPTSSNTLATPTDRNVILFSLQFTADWDKDMLSAQKRLLAEHLDQLKDTSCEVLLRHHPRYNNVIAIDGLLQKYPFAKVTQAPLADLLPKVRLQVTYHSTTAFEYAQMGIPSFFMHSPEFPHDENLMYEEFCYPLYKDMQLGEVVARLDDVAFTADGKAVNSWYRRFYSDFDKEAFLKILQ